MSVPFTLASPERRSPELEALAQRLRPYEEMLAYDPPAGWGVDRVSTTFREIWQIASGPGSGKAAGELSVELVKIARAAHEAARHADLAAPYFYLLRRSEEPERVPTATTARARHRLGPPPRVADPNRPEPRDLGITTGVYRRTQWCACKALDEARLASRLLGRFMREFPLYRMDLEWGPRPAVP